MTLGDFGLIVSIAGALLMLAYGEPRSKKTRPEHRKFGWAGLSIVFVGLALQGWDRFA